MEEQIIEGSRFRKGLFAKTKVVFCERFDETSDIWNLDEHEHPFLEVMYFLNGGARVHSCGSELSLSVFDVVVYPENQPHHEEVDLSRTQEVVCLGFEIPANSGLDKIYRLTDFDSTLKWLFIELHRQFKSDNPDRHYIVEHLTHLLLFYLKNALESLENIEDPIRRVILYMHDNISKSLSIEKLTNIAHYSASYLNRRFKEETGNTPLNYLKQIKMNTAKKLLENNSLDLLNIAQMVGFEDPKYFSKIFSETFGLSPTAYRKKLTSHQ
ncbi:MAG: AraC family transcriptional regulator [Sphaerochaetaceae bacterium]